MKFLMLALEVEEGSFTPFIINVNQLSLVFDDELGDEWCLKLVLKDGSEHYCTHILTKKGVYAGIGSMTSFYKDLIAEDNHE